MNTASKTEMNGWRVRLHSGNRTSSGLACIYTHGMSFVHRCVRFHHCSTPAKIDAVSTAFTLQKAAFLSVPE